MTPPASPSDREAGFTIVELLIAVVITGLISAVLAAVLFQGLALGGMTRDRTRYAANATLFTDRLADDVANAASVSATNTTMLCTWTKAAGFYTPTDPSLSAARLVSTLASVTMPSGPKVTYIAVLTQNTTAVNQIVVERRVGNNEWNPSEKRTILVGYCTNGAGTTVYSASSTPDPVYTLTLNLRPMQTSEIRTFKLNALRRDLVAPLPPPP